jgi:hypothetical protein
MAMTREEWLAAVSAELGVPIPADQELLLDLTREIAHGVERPAGPLTLLMIGAAGGGVADAVARVRALL